MITSRQFLAEKIVQKIVQNVRDKPPLNFQEWSERFLENENERFRFRPYQRQPALDLFDPRIQYVALRWYSGAGKTYLLTAAHCYAVHQLGLQSAKAFPGEGLVKSWMRKKLEPFIRATPCMAQLTFEKHGDGILQKRWTNGASIDGCGLNSGGATRTLEVDITDADEVDAIEQDAGDEGDKLKAYEKRTRGRKRQFHWCSSYPSEKGSSKIDSLVDDSDDCRWIVNCIHCLTAFEMHSRMIVYPRGEPRKAEFECPHCGRGISDRQRVEMSMAGRWRDKWGNTIEPEFADEFRGKRGYHLNCMAHVGDYAESHSNYLAEIAAGKEGVEKADNKEKARRVFVNTMDAESYAPNYEEKADGSELLKRREKYDPESELPEGVLFLTAGMDVQGNRLECEVVGWGEKGHSWACGYFVIHGFTDRPTTWKKADELFRQTWQHPTYGPMRIQCAMVDSQYRQEHVFRFTRGKGTRKIYACHGSTNPRMLGVVKGKRTGGKVRQRVFEINTNQIKEAIYSNLLVLDQDDHGYCHFPELDTYDERYFEMLQAEEREWKNGNIVFLNPEKKRNEALDLRVYASAARLHLQPNFEKLKANLEAKANPEPKKQRSAPVRPPQLRKNWI